MNKLITTFCLVLLGLAASAQNCFWHEDFEVIDSVISAGNPGFSPNTHVQHSGVQCDSAVIVAGGVSTLTSIPLDFTGNFFVTLSFWHICRIDFFDAAKVWASNDGGFTWTQLTSSLMCPGATDSATFGGQGNIFTSATYLDWDPANPGTPVTNAMWKYECFDLSSLVGGQNPCLIKFELSDVSNPGAGGYPGWFIDDICIQAAACELNPPTISYINPLQGQVYNLGPYNVFANITDASGLLSQNMTYTINGGAPTTVAMTFVTGDTYTAGIPAVNDGDTVCYFVDATDNSGCNNVATTNTLCFLASTGISFPYCDNFDINNLWVDSAHVSGSIWELGAPLSGWPNAAQSAPNCWEVALNQQYLDNTDTYLYSPIINFGGAFNASIDLWVNAQCENFWDGTRLQADTVGNGSWFTIGDCAATDPNPGTNWYNQCNINSSPGPAWSGTSQVISGQTGWFPASHTLSMLDDKSYVQLRFTFTSDASVTGDGLAIDGICITVPSPQDAGITQISQPSGQAPAGSCLPVIVTLKNFGSQPITSTPITYVQTSGTGMPQTGTVTWTGLLLPGATEVDTILPCFTVPAGAFCIQAYTTLPTDGNNYNDSTTLCGVGIPVLTPSICDDMESGNIGWLANPATGWQIGVPAVGGAHSPVNVWGLGLTGTYAQNLNDTLYSPIYDMQAATVLNPTLTFWQYRNTQSGNDGFRIEYEVGSTGAWQVLGLAPPPQDPNAINWYNQDDLDFSGIPAWDGTSNGWVKSTYFLAAVTPFPGTFIRFRYIFHSNFGTQLTGVSIDDFCVNVPCANDVGPFSANSYTQSLGGSPAAGTLDSVTVVLHNFGTANQTGLNISYQIMQGGVIVPGGGPFTTTVSGLNLTINPPAWNSASIVLDSSYTVPSGAYQIVVFTNLTGDCNAGNDTIQTTGVGVPIIPLDYNNAYCDDFESGNVGWTVSFGPGADVSTIWEFGLPAFAPTNTTHSGVTAWDINLSTAYGASANVYLSSPIFDFTQAVDTKIDFWQNFSTQNFADGVDMEVSINSGPWTHFGDLQTQVPGSAFNWYLQPINSNPAVNGAWTGNSPGWQHSIWYNLNSNPQIITFNNQQRVQFRFHFTSDQFGGGNGYTIDDFCLTVPVPLTTNPTVVTDLPTTPHLNFPGQTICFQANIKNDGTTPITSTVVELAIDGVYGLPQYSDTITYSPALAPGASQVHQFNTCWSGAPGTHTFCAVTTYPNASADLKPVNDTICNNILIFDSAQISTQPKCYDFETGAQWVTLNSINLQPTSTWALGLPAKANLNTAHSGTNAWITGGLVSDYTPGDTSSLFSPLFIVNGNLVYNLSFWTQYMTEKNEDGGTVDYSIDYGVTWHQFGDANPQTSPNWMNTFSITALQIGAPGPFPHSGWSGTGLGWAQRDHDFCLGIQGTQNIIFRWRFNSDFSVNDQGWEIDDVCLTPLAATCPIIIGVEEQISDDFALLQNAPNPFGDLTTISFSIKEKGQTELQILDITGHLISTPISGELAAGNYTVNVKAGDLASGIYFYALKHNDARIIKKMVVAK